MYLFYKHWFKIRFPLKNNMFQRLGTPVVSSRIIPAVKLLQVLAL